MKTRLTRILSAVRKKKIALRMLAGIGVLLLLSTFVHYTEPTELGIMRNMFTGTTQCDTPGWHFSAPWVLVAKVDLRPTRVCVSSSSRSVNCRLVQFEPHAWEEFVQTEGFRYYWWANRISFNWGYEEEYRGFRDILRGYAYSSTPYDFVTVLQYE